MKIINKPVSYGQSKLLNRLRTDLKNYNRVLWLISGGSSLPVARSIMAKLTKDESKRLAILLSDERYGKVGHPDSNLEQLYKLGFDPKLAIVVPILHENMDLDQTTKLFTQAAKKAFEAADTIISQCGIGADGHIAGILPHSLAATSKKIWAVGYQAPDFIRITLSPFALSHINYDFSFVYGDNKKEAIRDLNSKLLKIGDQPAQILKHIARVYVYNDQLGVKK